MKRILFFLVAFFVILACSKEEETAPAPAPKPKFSVTIVASEGGSVSSTGGTYEQGSTFSVTATAASGYRFVGWSNGETSSTINITVVNNLSLTATFEKITYSIDVSGTIAKGAFLTGSTLTFYELNNSLSQTGKTYNTDITDQFGSYSLYVEEVTEDYARVVGEGFYWNEVTNETTSEKITLNALSEIKEGVNVNILTHLEYPRVEQLVKTEGKSFSDAKRQALTEVLSSLGIETTTDYGTAEQFNFANGDDRSKILAVVSIIIQAERSPAEVTTFITKVANELKDNGNIDDDSIKTEIAIPLAKINLQEASTHLYTYYKELNPELTAEDFLSDYLETAKAEFQQYLPDADGDGIQDDLDQCPDTPSDEEADANGCGKSQKAYQLTTTVEGSGSISEEIIVQPSASYDYGTTVRLTANPNVGWEFKEWTGDISSTENPYDILIEQEVSVTAVFVKKQFNLDLTIEGEGTVSKNPDQSSYEYQSSVELTSTPSEGWVFKEWRGDIPSTTNPITVEFNSDKEMVAVFERKMYDLNVSVNGEGAVAEEVITTPGRYEDGTAIELTATPANGWEFSGWTGDIQSTENPINITLTSEKNVTANFEEVDSDGDGVYDINDLCPNTPEGEQVDENGCSSSQIDTDEDGVVDSIDQCPDTPQGQTVNRNGCVLDVNSLDQDFILIGEKGNSRYYLSNDLFDFNGALDISSNLGVDLVAINSEEESNYLCEIITNLNPSKNIWIGLSDKDNEGSWVWTNGDPLTFENWVSGEPDNGQGNEHFARISPGNCKWQDVDNDSYGNNGLILIEIYGSGNDSDGDGFIDEWDKCPNSNPNSKIDEEGCEIPQFEITISTEGEGEVTQELLVSPSTESYYQTSEVSLKATPNSGWYFDKWIGDIEDTSNPLVVRIEDNISITAVFKEISEFNECGDILVDIDGNAYRTVKIGSDCWMADNLRTTRDSNGNDLSFSKVSEENFSNYGYFYAWTNVTSRNPCPSGWEIPSEYQWDEMNEYYDPQTVGGMLKSVNNLWDDPNVGATNELGFNALPNGILTQQGYEGEGLRAVYATKTPLYHPYYKVANINGSTSQGPTFNSKSFYSVCVRCVLDGSELDFDNDGVLNKDDNCIDTPLGEEVDENGCSLSQKDSDNDGITDDIDSCPDTPSGEEVDENGCSLSQKDSDNDGLNDNIDSCPDTPSGEEVDENGCSLSQKDSDNDGVTDDLDLCPSTEQGLEVTENGCEITPIYLDENGVTLKVEEWADTGGIYKYLGEEYLIVETKEQIINWKNQGKNVKYVITTRVEDMSDLFTDFRGGAYQPEVSSWDVSNVTNTSRMFRELLYFNEDLSFWDVSNVTDMSSMFVVCRSFNQDLTSWDVSNVTNMYYMFTQARDFNGDISNWDVSNVTNMQHMFSNTEFNQDLSEWDVSNVTDMSYMFYDNEFFNGDISTWDVSNVTVMNGMFVNADSFNMDISNWNVSSVTNMSGMFSYTNNFNQDISNWDVSNVTDMSRMFSYSESFDIDISSWDVSSVTNMNETFRKSIFNQDISSWNVSSVTNMVYMFADNNKFYQDLSKWCVINVSEFDGFSAGNTIIPEEYLPVWGTCPE